ncbi:molybdopterin-dependent oxidoreductase alpha subunit [Arthrobacter pigmenti]|uniref:Molybdopterin-dependent oxidoreductase alpha subunit n=1 Tax=Arthrobacter pigmenti TaxID=271432 RepID=A0A846RHZ8_9MICC|nr:FdhF/YdeP family oxidoreductase [Arthrobacter pigmenti]NJC21320.1 molybdopterin-dependent oxidoreductase alpha subunit [Arthrobacter pigmenti]
MATRAPKDGINEAGLKSAAPKKQAVGLPAVAHALKISLEQMGPVRSAQTLLAVNQVSGFDCPGCAWPEGENRHRAEFCENGAKAVAEEATKRTVPPSFFERFSVSDLSEHDDFWLGQQGRLTHPMLLDDGGTHYRPASWDEAFGIITEELEALQSPDEAVFYTSGRTSNEAAFLYQLMVRGIGTNNLPDCSNMCHESSGSALTQTIGIGKGSVSLEDLETAPLILIAGQNPGTNHPRMLTSLEKAKKNGAQIVAINPLPEAGLMTFENPQTVSGLLGSRFGGGTQLADDFLQIRIGGDQALFQGIGKHLLEREEATGTVFDHDFIRESTLGLDEYLHQLRTVEWDSILEATGLTREQIVSVAERMIAAKGTIVCWAMGLTQHKHSVAMLRDVVNVLLLQGNIGKPGAGLCPVRGHSNVQGDRTMGIFERMPPAFHDALDARFSFSSPRKHGYDTVGAIRAMRDGNVRVFMAMGGNFVRATPDSEVTDAALRTTRLTVQVSTKLNRSHLITGRRALILPALGRTDRDTQASGDQRVTVEDSMSAVHASRGRLTPPGPEVRSEIAIVCGLAEHLFSRPDSPYRASAPKVDWPALQGNYALIREHIAAVIPGFESYEKKIDDGGFILPHGPRDNRHFPTETGKASFTGNQLEYPRVPEGRLLLQTLRSHDQYNTTIYGKDDRYRGIRGGRRVVFVHAEDLREAGLTDGSMVHLVSEYDDGVQRRAENFRAVAYPTPRGCAAAYYPETNVLVPLDSTADVSGTPTSKSVVIRLEKATAS